MNGDVFLHRGLLTDNVLRLSSPPRRLSEHGVYTSIGFHEVCLLNGMTALE